MHEIGDHTCLTNLSFLHDFRQLLNYVWCLYGVCRGMDSFFIAGSGFSTIMFITLLPLQQYIKAKHLKSFQYQSEFGDSSTEGKKVCASS